VSIRWIELENSQKECWSELWAARAHRGLAASFFLGLSLLLIPMPRRSELRLNRDGTSSPQEDITLANGQRPTLKSNWPALQRARVDAYLTQLGARLAQKLPTGGVQYPFEFHCVNDKAVNAFALPGGYVFVNRGAIEAADNEAQLAAVMAHELSHVAMRHGTNQATKAMLAEAGPGFLAQFSETPRAGALLTTLGNFTAGGVLLRYSRTAESQADVWAPRFSTIRGTTAVPWPSFSKNSKRRPRGRIRRSFSPIIRTRKRRVGASMKKLRNSAALRQTPSETPLNSKRSSAKSWPCRW